jgi:hypothetical protein
MRSPAGQSRAAATTTTASAAAPTTKETNAARTELPSQAASWALIPNWIGSIAPAASANSR